VRHGRGDAVQAERAHWTELATVPAGRTPADDAVPAGEVTVGDAATVTASLDAAATAELLRLPDALGCGLPAVLLAALGRTLASWTGHDRHVVDLVRHDRVRLFDEVDLSRTVGPFGHVHPVALDVAADGPADAAVRAVAAHLRGVPGDGVGWELLRQDADPVPDAPVDLAFALVDGPPRPALDGDESPRNLRRRALEVEVRVVDDELLVRWTYGRARHHEATVTRVAERYAAELRALAELASGPAGAPAASDFPLAHVDQDQLDALLSRL
jgi:hypothetical protein